MRSRRVGRRIPIVAAAVLLACLVPLAHWTLSHRRTAAADEPPASQPRAFQGERAAQSTAVPVQETVRLNFFNSTWPTVLRKLAEETGSQLVMQEAPRGRWTRLDHRRYSRSEAVRLINRELEPKGFRVIERGDYLVLLDLDTLRTRYPRPVVPASSSEPSHSQGTAEPSAAGPKTPRPDPSGSQTDPVQRLTDLGESQEPGRGEPGTGAVSDDPEASPLNGSQPMQPDEQYRTVVLRHREAVEVAKLIHEALKPRSELLNEGPAGLPAFRVYESGDSGRSSDTTEDRAVDFTIGMDLEKNALVVEAPPERLADLAGMIRGIDRARVDGGGVVRLVSTQADVETVAARLRPMVRTLVAQNRDNGTESGAGQQEAPDPFQAQPEQAPPPEQDGRQQRPVPAPPPAEGEPLLQIQGLRGEVTIRDVPGVGLVVTGNREDVETVMQMIEELERVAGRQVPDFHLLMLQHVNSVALAGLLNTVYEELTQIRAVGAEDQPSASILPIVKPNALLIIGSQSDIQAITDLAEELDQPLDPQTEFQVFPLDHAVATQVVQTLQNLAPEQPEEGTGQLRTRVRAVADARTNSVIVQAAPRDLDEIARLIEQIDRDQSSAVNRMRVFPLQNAVAEELAQVINSAVQSILSPTGAGPGQQPGAAGETAAELQQAKSVVLEFLAPDGDAQDLVRSGILTDIRVTADPRANSLIVTAPEQSMALMAALIRHLDQPSSTVADIKVFRLTNSDATAMAEMLRNLFQPGEEGQPGGVQLAGAEDASSSLVPLRFEVDTRTNSLIAVGGAEALRVVEAILLRLDQTDVRRREMTVVRLKNSPVVEVADAINAFLQSQRDLAQIDPELVSNVEMLEREVIVVPEPVTNSLIISATPRYFEEIMSMIERLDRAPAQVVIQVLIVEVELDNTDEFGVELGFQDSVLFDRGLLNLDTFQTIQETFSNPATGIQTTTQRIVNEERVPGFLFNNQQLGNAAVEPGTVGEQGLTNFSLGRVNADLGFGGLVLSASSESVSVLIRALAAKRNVHILSRPQIRTLDNQLAQIQVGQQVPVISGFTSNAFGGISPTLGTPQQVGIILQVTPRINPDGTIVMETIANKSALSGEGVPLAIDPNTGQAIESPIFDLTEAIATVAVPDGQTIVLGGMISERHDTIERKVPWLGDIPYLGLPFRYDSTRTRRTELLIFMTPRIVRNDADSELIKQVETERMHFVEEKAEEIHGPLFAVPPAPPQGPAMPGPAGPPVPGRGAPRPPQPGRDGNVPTTIMPARPSGPAPKSSPPSQGVPRD